MKYGGEIRRVSESMHQDSVYMILFHSTPCAIMTLGYCEGSGHDKGYNYVQLFAAKHPVFHYLIPLVKKWAIMRPCGLFVYYSEVGLAHIDTTGMVPPLRPYTGAFRNHC